MKHYKVVKEMRFFDYLKGRKVTKKEGTIKVYDSLEEAKEHLQGTLSRAKERGLFTFAYEKTLIVQRGSVEFCFKIK